MVQEISYFPYSSLEITLSHQVSVVESLERVANKVTISFLIESICLVMSWFSFVKKKYEFSAVFF